MMPVQKHTVDELREIVAGALKRAGRHQTNARGVSNVADCILALSEAGVRPSETAKLLSCTRPYVSSVRSRAYRAARQVGKRALGPRQQPVAAGDVLDERLTPRQRADAEHAKRDAEWVAELRKTHLDLVAVVEARFGARKKWTAEMDQALLSAWHEELLEIGREAIAAEARGVTPI